MRVIYYFAIVIIFSACSGREITKEGHEATYEMLEGDWAFSEAQCQSHPKTISFSENGKTIYFLDRKNPESSTTEEYPDTRTRIYHISKQPERLLRMTLEGETRLTEKGKKVV